MRAASTRNEHPELIAELGTTALSGSDRLRWLFVLREENQAIARRVARKWKSTSIAKEDVQQTAQVGLYDAVGHWKGGSWGEWMVCAESWIGYHLQVEAARHRVAHVPDDEMRIARKVQAMRRLHDAVAVAELLAMTPDSVRTFELVPLSCGRSELSLMVVGRKSYIVDSEDRMIAALDAKRSGATLATIDNAHEKQPDLPSMQDIVSDTQPRKLTRNKAPMVKLAEPVQMPLFAPIGVLVEPNHQNHSTR